MKAPLSSPPKLPLHPLERYYRFHARIYDATRWSFLFGRASLIQTVASLCRPTRVLEVGCGTGKNLVRLCEAFPGTALTGLDLSAAMLDRARKNLAEANQAAALIQKSYDQPLEPERPFDLLIFSYALSMFNPGWEQAIDCASQDLASGGLIAVVDFHQSPFPFFKRWMRLNHVCLDSHLLPQLESRFRPRVCKIYPAYGGIWSYFLFLGEKTG